MSSEIGKVHIKPPSLTEYQIKMLYGDERFTITEAATKCGKTFSHLWWLFEQAAKSKKDGANFWWVAPVYSQSLIAFNRLRRIVATKPHFKINLNGTIQCPNGAVISFKSGEIPDNLFGDDVWAVVMDEFTRMKPDVWFALRSTVTKTGGKIKMIGNARGKKNWGFKLGAKARAGEPNYAYFRVTAYEAAAAGVLTMDEIEQAKRDLPEAVFRELYLAEPSEDGSNPFGLQHIQLRVQKNILSGAAVCFGVDLAKYVDWTVIVGLDGVGNIVSFKRFQMDWSQTRAEIIRTVGNTPTIIDSSGVGDPIVEDIQKECKRAEGFKYSATSKQQLMQGLAHGIQNGLVNVLDGIMRDEVESFEFNYSANGVTYSAPEGMHDDCVNALALAHRLRMFMKPPIQKPKFSY